MTILLCRRKYVNRLPKGKDDCMKRRWIGLRIVVSLCAALGWWGLIYPELTLTPETVKVSVEDENGELQELPEEWEFDSSLYREILNADRSQITFRSRLLTDFSLFLEALHDRSGNKQGCIK